LRIGTSEGISAKLNTLLARFAEERPNASIRLEAIHTPAKLRALRDGDLDIAFLRAPLDTTGLRMVELWSEPLVAVLPTRHPLAAREAIPLAALSSLPLMLGPRSKNPGMHDQLLALCERCGLNPRLGRQLDNVQEALATISTGAAWTLLTATNAPQHTPGVAVRAIAETNAHTTVALAWRPTGHNALSRTFIELAVHARDRGELAPPSNAG
jgi:DNA-binding transcriptional LysR family regulator